MQQPLRGGDKQFVLKDILRMTVHQRSEQILIIDITFFLSVFYPAKKNDYPGK